MFRLHGKKVMHFLFLAGTIALEVFLGYRAALMYEQVLQQRTHVDGAEVFAIKIIVLLAVSITGVILATYRHQAMEAVITRIEDTSMSAAYKERAKGWAQVSMYLGIGFVITHDIAAILYTMWGESGFDGNAVSVLVVIGMTSICVLPFVLGQFTSSLGEMLMAERNNRLRTKAEDLRDRRQMIAMQHYIDEENAKLKRGEGSYDNVLEDKVRDFLSGPASFLDDPQPKQDTRSLPPNRRPFLDARANEASHSSQSNGRH